MENNRISGPGKDDAYWGTTNSEAYRNYRRQRVDGFMRNVFILLIGAGIGSGMLTITNGIIEKVNENQSVDEITRQLDNLATQEGFHLQDITLNDQQEGQPNTAQARAVLSETCAINNIRLEYVTTQNGTHASDITRYNIPIYQTDIIVHSEQELENLLGENPCVPRTMQESM